ncbi:hypothetical protein ACIGFK_20300 [Streptomyces sp. NPDC085524]|uniref:hypothetical protein n=1 Tax=Streptomyces sp. NPDC085524 TaxID=3365728 RepID=UPI0037CFE39C
MHEDEERRTEEQGLTTEQFARSGDQAQPPLYPGEATADDTRAADRGEMRQEADLTDAEEGAYGEGPGSRDEASAGGEAAGEAEALLPEREAEGYRKTWGEIQGRFVDDPQGAVREADGLVAEVMQALAGVFSEHKKELEGQWQQGEQVATEELRLALQKYRSFFGRLLRT